MRTCDGDRTTAGSWLQHRDGKLTASMAAAKDMNRRHWAAGRAKTKRRRAPHCTSPARIVARAAPRSCARKSRAAATGARRCAATPARSDPPSSYCGFSDVRLEGEKSRDGARAACRCGVSSLSPSCATRCSRAPPPPPSARRAPARHAHDHDHAHATARCQCHALEQSTPSRVRRLPGADLL